MKDSLPTVPRTPFQRVVLLFTSLFTAVILFRSVIHWACWYVIIRPGRDQESFLLLGNSLYEWADIGRMLLRILGVLSVLFAVAVGVLFLFQRCTLKAYLCSIVLFFAVPLTVIYLAMVLFDPDAASGGVEAMIQIPYRRERWLLFLVCGVLGAVRECVKKHGAEDSGIEEEKRQKQKRKLDPQEILLLSFTVVSVILNVCIFTVNWMYSYLLLAAGRQTSLLFGKGIQEWMSLAGRLRMVHFGVCFAFAVVFGAWFLIRGFSLRFYLFGSLLFYLVSVWICYVMNTVLDPGAMTNAVDNLLWIPMRPMRWLIIVLFGVLGWLRPRVRKSSSGSRSV